MEMTTTLSISDELSIIPDIFNAMNLTAEIEPNMSEYISPYTNKGFMAVESVSVAIVGTKATWMTQTDWMMFQGLMSRLIADGTNNGVNSNGVSYLDLIEKELEAKREAA